MDDQRIATQRYLVRGLMLVTKILFGPECAYGVGGSGLQGLEGYGNDRDKKGGGASDDKDPPG